MPAPRKSSGLYLLPKQAPSGCFIGVPFSIFEIWLLISEIIFSPQLPVFIKLPEEGICGQSKKILLVANIMSVEEESLQIIVDADENDKAMNVKIGILEKKIEVWAVVDETIMNLAVSEEKSLDLEEPFVIS